MTGELNPRQLTGREESHLVELPGGHRLQAEVAAALAALQDDARAAGFELAIASSFRSYARQMTLWNGKASGARPVLDDAGRLVAMQDLSAQQQMHAILRYSALPGSSRHHWGTDLDIYDAAACPADYQVQLTPREVAPGGIFDGLHCWLDDMMAAGRSHGFYRPYAEDRGGVAPERWHLSYAPLSLGCAGHFNAGLLQECWDCEKGAEPLLLRREVQAQLPQLLARYVNVAEDWCAPFTSEQPL